MESAETGRTVGGRYRLDAVIGRGGMGVVWRARDELLERDVAVKELVWPADLTEDERETACRRAIREAQMAGRLSHLNVVRIYDILEEDGHPWIIMELLPYPSLRDLVRTEGPLTPARAARVGLGVLAALRAAHAEGVLHRDVKPANILVGPDGRVVLTDFGIARAGDSPTLTAAGTLVGSPAYIAPERARGEQARPAADLWALGASLYAAVEGRPPFERDAPVATLTAVVIDEPEEAVHAGPLWPVISGLLRKDPDDRLDPAEAERLLSRLADGDATQEQAGTPDATRPAVEPGAPAPAPRAVSRRPRLGRRAALALAAMTAAAAAVAFILIGAPGHPAGSSGASAPATRDPTTSPAASPSASPATPSAAGPSSAAPTAASSSGTGSSGGGTSSALPAGYYRFTNSTGFSIGVPSGWRISHVGHYVYVTDPANGGIFLLIDQSDTPNPNPLADWQQQAANRAGTYPDYHLIRLQSVYYPQAEKAADWEFTYVRSGIPVHILNRNVLADAHHAYALYWSTPEVDWTADFHYFQAFASSFRPA